LEPRPWETPRTNALLANGTALAFALFYAVNLWIVWRATDGWAAVRALGRILGFYLLLASLWFHPWYVLWWLVLVALIEDTPTRRLALVFSYWVTWQPLLYSYFSLETKAGVRTPWLDFFPVALVMGIAWWSVAHYVVGWALARSRRTPETVAMGKRFIAAPEQHHETLSERSDRLGIPYDHLQHAEQGLRLPLLSSTIVQLHSDTPASE
jgi:hypothetical protein